MKLQPGGEIRGIEALGRFYREVLGDRAIFEISARAVHELDERRIVVEGRMRWMDEDRVLRDDPVAWALELEGGLIRRSTAVRTYSEAEALLPAPPRDTTE
jgi:hypothetical protein